MALNVAQTVLIGRAISFGFPFDYAQGMAQDKGGALEGQSGLGWLPVAFAGVVLVRAALNWAACLTANCVSAGLLEQMLQDLARMGYIEPLGGACDTSLCHRCPLGGSCATDTRGNVWVLTAKGARAAARMAK